MSFVGQTPCPGKDGEEEAKYTFKVDLAKKPKAMWRDLRRVSFVTCANGESLQCARMTERAAVILAGGAGTRLRPLSSDENPKQFLQIFDGDSLLQRTFARLEMLLPPDAIYVSTNAQYAAKCLAQLPRLRPENVIAEPARRIEPWIRERAVQHA